MRNILTKIATAEDGAVSIDWVVLCAALVGFSVVLLGTVNAGTDSLSANIFEFLSDAGLH